MAQQQLNRLPQFAQPLASREVTNKDWYFFWAGLWRGLAPELEAPVTPTGSPFSYSAPRRGSLIVSGGTVSQIRFSRDGSTFYNVGATAGMFALSAADRLEVTYSAPPTLTFVPS
jgi:hypothetical protein